MLEWLRTKVVHWLVSSKISQWIALEEEQVRLGATRVEASELEVERQCLDGYHLPLVVSWGRIGNIAVEWRSVKTIGIVVSKISIELRPRRDDEFPDTETVSSAHRRRSKRERLRGWEALVLEKRAPHLLKSDHPADEALQGEGAQTRGVSTLERLKAAVLNNLEVEIEELEVTYRASNAAPSLLKFRLEKGVLRNGSSGSHLRVAKQLEVQGVAVMVADEGEAGHVPELGSQVKERQDQFPATPSDDSWTHVLEPTSGRASVEFDRFEPRVMRTGAAISLQKEPQRAIAIDIGDAQASITSSQLKTLVSVAHMLAMHSKGRPLLSPRDPGGARSWWKYVASFVMEEAAYWRGRGAPEYLVSRRPIKERYKVLYAEMVSRASTTSSALLELDHLEEELCFEEIVLFRTVVLRSIGAGCLHHLNRGPSSEMVPKARTGWGWGWVTGPSTGEIEEVVDELTGAGAPESRVGLTDAEMSQVIRDLEGDGDDEFFDAFSEQASGASVVSEDSEDALSCQPSDGAGSTVYDPEMDTTSPPNEPYVPVVVGRRVIRLSVGIQNADLAIAVSSTAVPLARAHMSRLQVSFEATYRQEQLLVGVTLASISFTTGAGLPVITMQHPPDGKLDFLVFSLETDFREKPHSGKLKLHTAKLDVWLRPGLGARLLSFIAGEPDAPTLAPRKAALAGKANSREGWLFTSLKAVLGTSLSSIALDVRLEAPNFVVSDLTSHCDERVEALVLKAGSFVLSTGGRVPLEPCLPDTSSDRQMTRDALRNDFTLSLVDVGVGTAIVIDRKDYTVIQQIVKDIELGLSVSVVLPLGHQGKDPDVTVRGTLQSMSILMSAGQALAAMKVVGSWLRPADCPAVTEERLFGTDDHAIADVDLVKSLSFLEGHERPQTQERPPWSGLFWTLDLEIGHADVIVDDSLDTSAQQCLGGARVQVLIDATKLQMTQQEIGLEYVLECQCFNAQVAISESTTDVVALTYGESGKETPCSRIERKFTCLALDEEELMIPFFTVNLARARVHLHAPSLKVVTLLGAKLFEAYTSSRGSVMDGNLGCGQDAASASRGGDWGEQRHVLEERFLEHVQAEGMCNIACSISSVELMTTDANGNDSKAVRANTVKADRVRNVADEEAVWWVVEFEALLAQDVLAPMVTETPVLTISKSRDGRDAAAQITLRSLLSWTLMYGSFHNTEAVLLFRVVNEIVADVKQLIELLKLPDVTGGSDQNDVFMVLQFFDSAVVIPRSSLSSDGIKVHSRSILVSNMNLVHPELFVGHGGDEGPKDSGDWASLVKQMSTDSGDWGWQLSGEDPGNDESKAAAFDAKHRKHGSDPELGTPWRPRKAPAHCRGGSVDSPGLSPVPTPIQAAGLIDDKVDLLVHASEATMSFQDVDGTAVAATDQCINLRFTMQRGCHYSLDLSARHAAEGIILFIDESKYALVKGILSYNLLERRYDAAAKASQGDNPSRPMSSTARSLQEALKELRRAAASCYPSAAQAHSKHGLAEQDCRLSFRLGVDVVRLCVLARDHTAGNGTPFLQIDSTDLAFEYWLPNVSGSQAQVQWNSLLQSTRMTIDCTLPQREHCLFSFDGNASAFEMYFKQQGQKHQPGTPLHRGTKLLNSVEKQFSLFVRKTANHHLIYDLLTGTDSILSLDVGIFLSLVDWLLTSDPDLSDGRTEAVPLLHYREPSPAGAVSFTMSCGNAMGYLRQHQKAKLDSVFTAPGLHARGDIALSYVAFLKDTFLEIDVSNFGLSSKDTRAVSAKDANLKFKLKTLPQTTLSNSPGSVDLLAVDAAEQVMIQRYSLSIDNLKMQSTIGGILELKAAISSFIEGIAAPVAFHSRGSAAPTTESSVPKVVHWSADASQLELIVVSVEQKPLALMKLTQVQVLVSSRHVTTNLKCFVELDSVAVYDWSRACWEEVLGSVTAETRRDKDHHLMLWTQQLQVHASPPLFAAIPTVIKEATTALETFEVLQDMSNPAALQKQRMLRQAQKGGCESQREARGNGNAAAAGKTHTLEHKLSQEREHFAPYIVTNATADKIRVDVGDGVFMELDSGLSLPVQNNSVVRRSRLTVGLHLATYDPIKEVPLAEAGLHVLCLRRDKEAVSELDWICAHVVVQNGHWIATIMPPVTLRNVCSEPIKVEVTYPAYRGKAAHVQVAELKSSASLPIPVDVSGASCVRLGHAGSAMPGTDHFWSQSISLVQLFEASMGPPFMFTARIPQDTLRCRQWCARVIDIGREEKRQHINASGSVAATEAPLRMAQASSSLSHSMWDPFSVLESSITTLSDLLVGEDPHRPATREAKPPHPIGQRPPDHASLRGSCLVVEISPPLRLTNLLPETMHFQVAILRSSLEGRMKYVEEGLIAGGKQCCIMEARADWSLYLRLRMGPKERWSETVHISAVPQETVHLEIPSRSDRRLSVQVRVKFASGFQVSIAAENWIVNGSGLPLLCVVESHLHYDHPSFMVEEEPLALGHSNLENLQLALSMPGGDSSPVFSTSSIIGKPALLRVPNPSSSSPESSSLYLSVAAAHLSQKFQGTVVCTLGPQLLLQNETPTSFHVWQFSKDSDREYPFLPVADITQNLKPGMGQPVYSRYGQPKECLFAIALAGPCPDSSEFSAPFPAFKVGEYLLKLPVPGAPLIMAEVMPLPGAATRIVRFYLLGSSLPPYKIDNRTPFPIALRQSGTRNVHMVPPRTQLPIAWPDPSGQLLVELWKGNGELESSMPYLGPAEHGSCASAGHDVSDHAIAKINMAEGEALSTATVAGAGYAALHLEDGCRVLCVDSAPPQVVTRGAGNRAVHQHITARIDVLIVTLSTYNHGQGSSSRQWHQLCQLRLDETLASIGSSINLRELSASIHKIRLSAATSLRSASDGLKPVAVFGGRVQALTLKMIQPASVSSWRVLHTLYVQASPGRMDVHEQLQQVLERAFTDILFSLHVTKQRMNSEGVGDEVNSFLPSATKLLLCSDVVRSEELKPSQRRHDRIFVQRLRIEALLIELSAVVRGLKISPTAVTADALHRDRVLQSTDGFLRMLMEHYQESLSKQSLQLLGGLIEGTITQAYNSFSPF